MFRRIVLKRELKKDERFMWEAQPRSMSEHVGLWQKKTKQNFQNLRFSGNNLIGEMHQVHLNSALHTEFVNLQNEIKKRQKKKLYLSSPVLSPAGMAACSLGLASTTS